MPKEPLNVILDTCIFRSNPTRDKVSFRILQRLADDGKVVLHIPKIVEGEFLSQELESYSRPIRSLLTHLATLRRQFLPIDAREAVDNFNSLLRGLEQRLADLVQNNFKGWAYKMNAQLHDVGSEHGGRVLEAYFAGRTPFSAKKKRDDFPDAFLWESIIDIVRTHKETVVVSSDKALLEACSSEAGIHTYKSLEDFIVRCVGQEAIKQEHVQQAVRTLKLQLLYSETITENIRGEIYNELMHTLPGQSIDGTHLSAIPLEARLLYVDVPHDLQFSVERTEYYNDGLFVVPIQATLQAIAEYVVAIGDYNVMFSEVLDQMDDISVDDYEVHLEQAVQVKVQARLRIALDSDRFESADLTDRKLITILEEAEFGIESIEHVKIMDVPDC